MARIPERLTWAVAELGIEPGDHVLEIGCGTGVAAALILARLTTGRYVAIDRSPAMIAAAERRNAADVASGKAAFHRVALADADLGGARFDRALAVHVNAFWLRPIAELAALRRLLKPGGLLCLVYQPLAETGMDRVVENCTRSLEANGFMNVRVRVEELSASPVVAITAALAQPA